jgi:hypothetical protein
MNVSSLEERTGGPSAGNEYFFTLGEIEHLLMTNVSSL